MEAINIIPFFIGAFILGFSHAFEPDHMAVVSNYVYKSSSFKRSAAMGVFWGSGHTLALMMAGTILMVFKIVIPEHISGYFDYLIGLLLIGFGVNIFYRLIKSRTHIHIHDHQGKKHLHFHSHADHNNHEHSHRSFLFGILHGLAGTSSLMLIMISSIDSYKLGIPFILIFGIGSIIGMLIFSLTLWLSFNFTFKSFPNVNRAASYLTAAFSLFVGVQIIFF